MGFLLKAFTANPLVIVYFALAVFAAGNATGGAAAWTLQGWRLGASVEHAEKETASCQGSLGRTQDANAAFAGAVSEQTKSIRELGEAAAARDGRVLKALEGASRQGADTLAKADALLKRPLPATASGDCAALAADLSDFFKERTGRQP